MNFVPFPDLTSLCSRQDIKTMIELATGQPGGSVNMEEFVDVITKVTTDS